MPDSAREMPPQIAMLREIRDRLRDTLRGAHDMQHKLTGPRPPAPANELKQISAESVQGLIIEIDRLSQNLQTAICEHHQILGDFGEKSEQAIPRTNYA